MIYIRVMDLEYPVEAVCSLRANLRICSYSWVNWIMTSQQCCRCLGSQCNSPKLGAHLFRTSPTKHYILNTLWLSTHKRPWKQMQCSTCTHIRAYCQIWYCVRRLFKMPRFETPRLRSNWHRYFKMIIVALKIHRLYIFLFMVKFLQSNEPYLRPVSIA